jgi:hypothetical protein
VLTDQHAEQDMIQSTDAHRSTLFCPIGAQGCVFWKQLLTACALRQSWERASSGDRAHPANSGGLSGTGLIRRRDKMPGDAMPATRPPF